MRVTRIDAGQPVLRVDFTPPPLPVGASSAAALTYFYSITPVENASTAFKSSAHAPFQPLAADCIIQTEGKLPMFQGTFFEVQIKLLLSDYHFQVTTHFEGHRSAPSEAVLIELKGFYFYYLLLLLILVLLLYFQF